MFLRLIRVILTADVNGFAGGMGRAVGLLSGFLGAARNAFGGAMGFVNNLVNTLAHLPDAFNTVTEAIEGLFGPALSRERFGAIFESLTGSAEQSAEMLNFLRETSLATGKEFDSITQSSQQVAVALRSMNGEVDPALWEELTMAVVKFSTLRPDVPIELWGRAISGLLAGDVSTLTRLLDVNVSQMGQLSQEVKDFLNNTGEAREQQLGAVTRLGADTATDRDTALQALREILEATGATDDLLQASADTTQGKLDRLKAMWDDFVARVGEELLPILIEALDDLLAWIDEHEAEINTFLDGLGAAAKEAYEVLKDIDWEQVGKDVAKAGADAEEAWEWLKEFLKTVGEAVDKLNALYTAITGLQAPGTSGSITDIDTRGSVLGAFMGQGRPDGPIGEIGKALDQSTYSVDVQALLQKLEQLIDGGAAGNPSTNVNVTVTVDENGQLQIARIAKQQAQNVVGELIGAVGNTGEKNPTKAR